MQKLSLIDTHCDTAYELYHRKENIADNSCDISIKKAERYEKYAQFFAVWANKRLNDNDAYEELIISTLIYRYIPTKFRRSDLLTI